MSVASFTGHEFRAGPTQLEVETKLATPGKLSRGRSLSSRRPLPNARAGDRALEAIRSELYDFQDSVKGELEDMKAMVKLLLEEVRKLSTGGLEPAASSDVSVDTIQVIADKVATALPLVFIPTTSLRTSF